MRSPLSHRQTGGTRQKLYRPHYLLTGSYTSQGLWSLQQHPFLLIVDHARNHLPLRHVEGNPTKRSPGGSALERREHFCRNQRPDLLSLLMALENAQKRIQSQGILWHRFPLPHILHIAHSGSLLRSASARNLREERRAVPKPGRLAPFLTNLSIEPLTMLLFDGLAPLLANPGKIRGAILLIDGSSSMFGFGHCSFCCHGTPSFGLCVCCLMNAWLSSTVSGPFKHPGSSEQQYPLLFLSCFFCVIPSGRSAIRRRRSVSVRMARFT